MAVTGVFASATLEAQARSKKKSYPMVDVGSRVRIGLTQEVRRSPTPAQVQRVTGRVRAITPETLYVEVIEGTTPTAFARALISGVELSIRPPSRLGSAKEWGLTGGVYAGALMARPAGGRSGTVNTFIGLGAGGVLGAVFGFMRPMEKWQYAYIPG